MKLEFAPGCFDGFEGSQEELDAFIAELQRQIESGEFMENATPVDFDELDEDTLEALDVQIGNTPRRLN